MSENNDINSVINLFKSGRYAEAEILCDDLARKIPSNARLYYLYGLSCYQNGRVEKSISQFQKAVALNPQDFDSLFNMGVAYSELRQLENAIGAYQSLLIKAPHYTKALPNLGQVLVKSGHYEQGVETFLKALDADSPDIKTAMLLMEYECLYLPMSERISSCNRTLSLSGLSDSQRHTAFLYRATAEWALEDMTGLGISLSEASKIPSQTNDQGFMNMMIYKTFLNKLLEYRKNNGSLYEGGGKPLYIVGDSHSLTYAGLRLSMNNEHYKVHSHLVMGTQAWNLGSPQQDTKRHAVAYHFKSIAEGSTVLCAFGEIDCRTTYGILPVWKKEGGDLEERTIEVVRNYVASIKAMSAGRQLTLKFLSVPAPHPISGERQHVVGYFNRALERCVRDEGYQYIDLYTPILGANGFADSQYYIDSYHLKPQTLKDVLSEQR